MLEIQKDPIRACKLALYEALKQRNDTDAWAYVDKAVEAMGYWGEMERQQLLNILNHSNNHYNIGAKSPNITAALLFVGECED